jgi:four helix bundle protein
MADQMRRASKSICANFAEGFGKQSLSKLEFRKYLFIAIGSANEMIVWSSYSKDLNYIKSEICERWQSEYSQIAKMLQGLYKSIATKH